MEVGQSWHGWKKFLGNAVNAAEFIGLSEQAINDIAYRLGDFFAGSLDPANREQRLLKELWEVGDEEEKRVLTKMFARLSERNVDRE